MEDEKESLIIQRCQNGDKQAYGMLVNKYMKRAYFAALGLTGSHDSALDLSQEAFVRAYRAIDKLDANRKFYTWYYQILRNLCFNYFRDNTRHARSFSEIGEELLSTIADNTQDASALAEQNEIKQALWNAMETLKPQEKEIIILKDFQDMSYKEIAESLACPIGTVMSRLFNARKALKNKLEVFFHE